MRENRYAQNIFLSIISLLFYAWGEPYFVLVMMGSITINWLAGLIISNSEHKTTKARVALTVATVSNLLVLFVFKYLMFTVQSVNRLLLTELNVPEIALPIGLSFFTFQGISYVVDVYNDSTKAQNNIMNVCLYISFFPQLIAGPIIRYGTFETQIYHRKESWKLAEQGIERFIIGLSKKVLIANNMAIIADQAFSMTGGHSSWFGIHIELSAGMAWLGAIAYMFQIYYDFSGYSDMAIGLGRMFGFVIPENFNYPYISESATEFWHRWHISLGSWFKDYLYIPLGGSRCGRMKNARNLLLVWFFTGIWHGANWTFIIWGLYYYSILQLERMTGLNIKNSSGMTRMIRRAVTMLLVMLGWILFRAENLKEAAVYMTRLFADGDSDMFLFYISEFWPFLIVAALLSVPVLPLIEKKRRKLKGIAYIFSDICRCLILLILFIISISYCVKGSYNPFIYFNF